MTVFLCWYALAGICVGFFVNYALIKKFRTWEALAADFNTNVGRGDFSISPTVAKIVFPICWMVVFSIIWAPFIIYVGSRRE